MFRSARPKNTAAAILPVFFPLVLLPLLITGCRSGNDVVPPEATAGQSVAQAEAAPKTVQPAAGEPEDSGQAAAQKPALPQAVQIIEREDWDRSSPISSYHGIHSANHKNDVDWIVASFAPGERETVRQMAEDPAMLANNRKLHERIAQETIIKRVPYKEDYVILFVDVDLTDGRTFQAQYPFKQTAEGWLMTNDLADDPNFPLEDIH